VKKSNEELLNEETLVTIEHYNASNNTILFDFLDFKHFNRFLENYNFPLSNHTDASMVMFYNFSCSKRFQLGVYYNVNASIAELLVDAEVQNNSNIILFKINLKERDIREFIVSSNVSAKYIYEINTDRNGINNAAEKTIIPLDFIAKEKKLIIKCVGQGSWNEFSIEGNVKVVYDIGTSYLHSKQTVKNLMSLREGDYQKSKPIIILSHWDVDHYHMLLEASDETIKAVKVFIYRSLVPNKTSKKLVERFQNLNPDALCPVHEEPPPAGKQTSDKLEKLYGDTYGFYIFNGSKNKDRNKAGILLVLKTHTQVVVLGADFYYEQINKYVLPSFHYKHDHYLIVPHHGGEAGKFIYDNLYSVCKDSIISVGGKYSYNHPLFDVEEELRKKRFKLINFKTKNSPFEYDLLLH
jgi:beta-lactamase superfamily II metal-dependent hydrolase